MSEQLDANEVINGLLDEIGRQAKQIAMLSVQLGIAQKRLSEPTDTNTEGGD